MAIAYVAGNVAGDESGGTTRDSGSIAVTGSNLVLYAIVQNSDGSPTAPTGVAWDPTGTNQAFTQIGTTVSSTYGRTTLWRLIGPTSATAQVRATWGSSQGERIVAAVCYSGVDQTTPNDAVTQASNNTSGANIPTATLSTTTGDYVVAAVGNLYTSGSSAVTNPDGTNRVNGTTPGTGYDAAAIQDTTAAGASTTLAWDSTSSSGWGEFIFALNEAAAGGGVSAAVFINANQFA